MTNAMDVWPEGANYAFQGTVAETADAGTHVVTLTVTPAAGSEIQLLGLRIVVGATATAQVVEVYVTDGTNRLYQFYFGSDTTSGRQISVPTNSVSATGNVFGNGGAGPLMTSGMTLVASVQTTAVSVTQTFGAFFRIKSAKPTAALNDTVGAFTPTVNTDKVLA